MNTAQQDFIAGARDALPILLGVVPFAMVSGVGAINVGLTPLQAIGMSFIVFAGASQLAVFQLMSTGGLWLIMLLTALTINVRFTMYSATLAPYFQKLPMRIKGFLAYMLSDQAFAVVISRFNKSKPVNHTWYYLGTAGTIWCVWQVSAITGALLGTLVPASWGFDFAFPLSFMALMFAALKDRPTIIAALVGGLTAVLAKGLPYNLGLVLAALFGILAGYLAETVRMARVQEVVE